MFDSLPVYAPVMLATVSPIKRTYLLIQTYRRQHQHHRCHVGRMRISLSIVLVFTTKIYPGKGSICKTEGRSAAMPDTTMHVGDEERVAQ